jgi:hypothetical protein
LTTTRRTARPRTRRTAASHDWPPNSLWTAAGRICHHPDGTLRELGFFLSLRGIADGPFSGPVGEATARLTYAAEPIRTSAFGPWSAALSRPGRLTLYLQEQPAGSYRDPDSFTRGEPIAMFERRGNRILAPFDLDGGLLFDEPDAQPTVFDTTLVWSRIFEYEGEIHDVRDVITAPFKQHYRLFETPVRSPRPFRTALNFLCSAVPGGGER